ncbi:MAG: NADH-quinone oxidoreductase subunit [Actinomycetota bacterium]|jgi:NADH:ubiquinone oxidoreductase subunit C|nr:NADH-quinone oxidoreductase subunit [Actinomycetota bacterium]
MNVTTIAAAEWAERAEKLHSEGWQVLDLHGLDRLRLTPSEPRFEVVVQLLNQERKERQTVHVVAGGDPPSVPSVTTVWPTTNFMERETYDLYGITFEGHPNLTRILMPDEWEGHPLRKDYGVGKVPVEFIPQPIMQIDSPGQTPGSGTTSVQRDRLGQVLVEGDSP